MSIEKLSPEDLRSYRLNEAALAVAIRDWHHASVLIQRNIDRLRSHGLAAPAYIDRCEALLKQGHDAMRTVFMGLTDEGQVLRSVHPFAGLLDNDTRNRILRETRRKEWDEQSR